jgi:hypothetical protein
MGNGEKGIFVDTFQQPLFNDGELKVPEARSGIIRLPIKNE